MNVYLVSATYASEGLLKTISKVFKQKEKAQGYYNFLLREEKLTNYNLFDNDTEEPILGVVVELGNTYCRIYDRHSPNGFSMFLEKKSVY